MIQCSFIVALLNIVPDCVEVHCDLATSYYHCHKYDLAIEINTNATNEFTIYLPAPVDNSDETSKVCVDLRITKGEGDVAIIDAASGKVLKVIDMDKPSGGEVVRASISAAYGQLFIRTTRKLYCIGKGRPASDSKTK